MTKIIFIFKLIILLLVGSLILSSCKDDVIFAAENKTIIDTMFLNRKVVIEAEIDSLCLELNEQFYQDAVDSIMTVRLAEIESRLELLKAKSENQ